MRDMKVHLILQKNNMAQYNESQNDYKSGFSHPLIGKKQRMSAEMFQVALIIEKDKIVLLLIFD